MKGLRVCVVLAGLFVVLQGVAAAQTPQLLGELNLVDNSVGKVMLKSGCNLDWYSKVLMDSNLSPMMTKSLSTGTKVFMVGNCTDPAPQTIADVSQILLNIEMIKAESARRQAELDALRRTSTMKAQGDAATISTLTFINKSLDESVRARSTELAIKQQEVDERYDLQNVLEIVLTCALFAGTLSYLAANLLMTRVKSENLKFRKVRPVEFDGEKHDFQPVLVRAANGDVDIRRVCPLCSENNLLDTETVLKRHLQHCPERPNRVVVTINGRAPRKAVAV